MWKKRRQKTLFTLIFYGIIFCIVLKATQHKDAIIRVFSGPYFHVFWYSLSSITANFHQRFYQGKVWESELVPVLNY